MESCLDDWHCRGDNRRCDDAQTGQPPGCAGRAVLAAGRPGRLQGPDDDMVRRSVPVAESEEIDWGARWEQRRRIFLENSVGNKYFVYTAALSLLLIWLRSWSCGSAGITPSG